MRGQTLLAVVLVLSAPGAAHADCSSDDVRARATALLERDPFATMSVDVEIAGLTGRISIDGAGTRTVTGPDCSTLVESMALVIVMAARRFEEVPPPPTIAREEPPPRVISVTADAIASVGLGLSSLGFDQTLSLGARLRRRAVSLELDGTLHPADEVDAGAGSVRIAQTSFVVAACAHRDAVSLCPTFSAGWLTGRGQQLADASTERLPFIAPGARLGYEVGLSDVVRLRIALDIDAPLMRSRFLVDQMPVWTSRRLEGWLGAAAVVRIP